MKYLIIAMTIFSSTILFAAEKAITAKNWINHPSIVEIRKIFSDTEESIKKGEIKADQPFERESDRGGTEKFVLYADKEGLVYKCMREGGSEDSVYSMMHYYDSEKKLRFVFVKVAATNGAVAEYRIYYDRASKRIWHIRDFKTKVRYPFVEIWPDDLVMFNPWSVVSVD
ncbi:MAG TPA: hypothetical protein PKK43_06490 [Spirochaetota bacterium]|nr:hypothetical protein [Spirochaetota bacterium]